MALAYALDYIESHQLARLTNYGEYLEKHPPLYEVEILENTSWSCAHGIERWRSDCGCNCGSGGPGHPQPWTQAWRGPLRSALDSMRDALALRFEEKARLLLRDPWAARNDYLDVVHDRSTLSLDSFFQRHALRVLNAAERSTALKLLEMQHQAMLMYTSCGWFFSELSGIETVQILQHAGRVLHLARQVIGDDLESPFLAQMEKAKSNIPEYHDGRRIYEQLVRPNVVEWEKVAAHYAMTALFEEQSLPHSRVHCFQVAREDFHLLELGKTRLVVGRIRVSSDISQETALLSFGFLYLNSHNLIGGVRQGQSDDAYRQMHDQVTRLFTDGDFPGTICSLDRHFGGMDYSLRSLFRDEQRRILNQISQTTLSEAEATYRQLYENHTPLLRFLIDLRIPLTVLSVPLPRALQTAAEFIVNIDLRRAFEAEAIDLVRIRALLKEAQRWSVTLDAPGLGYLLKQRLDRLAESLHRQPKDVNQLQQALALADLARSLPFEVDLFRAQNVCYEILNTEAVEFHERSAQGEEAARIWLDQFSALADRLRLRTSSPIAIGKETAAAVAANPPPLVESTCVEKPRVSTS